MESLGIDFTEALEDADVTEIDAGFYQIHRVSYSVA